MQNADFKQKPNRQKKFSVHFSLITPSDITENVWYGNGMLEGSMNLMVNFRSNGLGETESNFAQNRQDVMDKTNHMGAGEGSVELGPNFS